MEKKSILIFAAIGLAAVMLVYAATTVLLTITTSGVMGTAKLEGVPMTIDWGTVLLNTPVQKVVSITNKGDYDITNLHAIYTMPEGFAGTLEWDAEGTNIPKSPVAKVTKFTLTITSGSGPLAFDIDIEGTYGS